MTTSRLTDTFENGLGLCDHPVGHWPAFCRSAQANSKHKEVDFVVARGSEQQRAAAKKAELLAHSSHDLANDQRADEADERGVFSLRSAAALPREEDAFYRVRVRFSARLSASWSKAMRMKLDIGSAVDRVSAQLPQYLVWLRGLGEVTSWMRWIKHWFGGEPIVSQLSL